MLSLAQHLLPWHELPIAVIDFETTGVNPKECMPVELAIVRFESGTPVGRWSTLIDPGIPIPAEASAIHGITDAMVADAPHCTELSKLLIGEDCEPLLEGAIPCAYNAPFDRTILHRLVNTHDDLADDGGQHYPLAQHARLPWVNPLVMVRHVDRYVRGPGRHKLTAACARRDIVIDGAHRALSDAEACGRLLFHDDFREMLGDWTISEVLRRQTAIAANQERERAEWLAKQTPREAT